MVLCGRITSQLAVSAAQLLFELLIFASQLVQAPAQLLDHAHQTCFPLAVARNLHFSDIRRWRPLPCRTFTAK